MPLEESALLPRDKHDLVRAEAIVSAGYPAVEPLMPHLLEWLQDMNWPVARVLAPFLARVGAPLERHLRLVFESTDDIWKYWVIHSVIAESPELRRIFRDDLQRLASSPTENERVEEVDEVARTVLQLADGREA
jgi:hypothetical protein